MKKITVCVPCYNEEDNVVPLTCALIELFERELSNYDYVIQFIDNHSEDQTRLRLEQLCKDYPNHVRVIFNSRNFRGKSALYGILQADGDCAVYLSADFQDPIEKIPELIKHWEDGALIVAAIKKTTKENQLMYSVRGLYYKLMHKYSEVGFIDQFCNFGVYDKKFLDMIRGLKNPNYSIRGNVAEYGYNICYVEYEQQKRRSGSSKYNVVGLLNLAITNFIDYTDILLKWAITIGGFGSFICVIVAIYFLIRKLMLWSEYAMGIAPIIIGVFFVGAINMFLLGIIGEYVLSVRKKVTDSPLVIEEKRINFVTKGKNSNGVKPGFSNQHDESLGR